MLFTTQSADWNSVYACDATQILNSKIVICIWNSQHETHILSRITSEVRLHRLRIHVNTEKYYEQALRISASTLHTVYTSSAQNV